MVTLLRMLEDAQAKLERQMRENAELRLHMKELQMMDKAIPPIGQPQDCAAVEDQSLAEQNVKLRAEVKAAYSELAELKQSMAMKDRKIAQLQSRNTLIMGEHGSPDKLASMRVRQNSMRANSSLCQSVGHVPEGHFASHLPEISSEVDLKISL